MEIIGKSGERRTVYLALLGLACIGAVLAVLTWQLVRQQAKAEREHLELTSKAVLQAVYSSYGRAHRAMRGEAADTRDFFRELEESGDIVFVGIVDETGNPVRRPAAGTGEARTAPALPPDALEELARGGRWQGSATYGTQRVFIAARALPSAQFAGPGRFRAGTPPGMDAHHREWRERETRPPRLPGPGGEASGSDRFLVVAVTTEKHFAVSTTFRRTAIFQAAYIAAAALFVWVLAARFLARRELAGKAMYLERFQAGLWDNLPDGLLVVEESGVIRAANPSAGTMLLPGKDGTARAGDTLAGKTMADVALPFSGANDEFHREVQRGPALLEMRSLPFRGEGGAVESMVILHDRTRVHTLEKSLADAEKRAAIGALATGVAHEIRNPLSALRGFAQYFAKKLAGRQPEEEYAHSMVRESDRLNRVITDVLYLSRPRELAPAATDLETVCRELETLLRLELRDHGVSLETRLEAPAAFADPDALRQALLNLILNAVEALDADASGTGGTPRTAGKVTVTSRRGTGMDDAEGTAAGSDAYGPEGTWVTVADTGPGIPEDAAAQAFEPFFTTKRKGTGLGLALVRSIMEGHGGLAVIGTAPEGGASVGLFFPDPAPQGQDDA